MFGYHGIQITTRIVIGHDMIFTTWFPIDASSSPVYEIFNLIQVTFISQNYLILICLMFAQYIANVSKFAGRNTFTNRRSLILGYSIAFHSDAVQRKFHMLSILTRRMQPWIQRLGLRTIEKTP
jgi:hypothetical protein